MLTRTALAALVLALWPASLGSTPPATSDAAHYIGQAEPDPRTYVRKRASRDRGWTGREWKCTKALVDLENRSWAIHAKNAQGSSAYGLFQILRMPEGTPLHEQVDRFWRYLDSRYNGSACQALNHHERLGWY